MTAQSWKPDALLPRAIAWCRATERRLLPQGRSLTADETRFARRIGIRSPERVRVIVRGAFPMPTDPDLVAAASHYGFGGPSEGGRTIGHAILVKPVYADNVTVISHELVHVAQIDRMGLDAFIERYLREVISTGYWQAPLEREAREGEVSRW